MRLRQTVEGKSYRKMHIVQDDDGQPVRYASCRHLHLSPKVGILKEMDHLPSRGTVWGKQASHLLAKQMNRLGKQVDRLPSGGTV